MTEWNSSIYHSAMSHLPGIETIGYCNEKWRLHEVMYPCFGTSHPLCVANNTTGTATQCPGRSFHGFLTFHNISNLSSILPSHSMSFFVLLLPTLSLHLRELFLLMNTWDKSIRRSVVEGNTPEAYARKIICILVTTELYGLLTTAYFRFAPHRANVWGHWYGCIQEIAKATWSFNSREN
jgi:hypothetical protein